MAAKGTPPKAGVMGHAIRRDTSFLRRQESRGVRDSGTRRHEGEPTCHELHELDELFFAGLAIFEPANLPTCQPLRCHSCESRNPGVCAALEHGAQAERGTDLPRITRIGRIVLRRLGDLRTCQLANLQPYGKERMVKWPCESICGPAKQIGGFGSQCAIIAR